MTIKLCDFCKKELTKEESVYCVNLGKKGELLQNGKRCEVCESCCEKVNSFIEEIRK